MSKNLLNFLLVAVIFSMYYLVISPLYTGVGSLWQPSLGIKALINLDNQYTETLSQAEDLYNQAESLKAQYLSIGAETRDKMRYMVPDTIDPVRLVSEVDSIANKTDVVLNDISYTEVPLIAGNKGAYGVTFSTKTTYSKFKELMHNYETSLRLFTIKSVSFNVGDKGDSIMNFQVKLETYYIK